MGFNNNRITQSKSIQGLKSVMNYADSLSDFENGFNSLVGYTDGTTRPTGVFGGTAPNLVKSIVTVNPLVNYKSLKLAKTGLCQGQGYYFNFTPTRADIKSGAVMTIKFKLELITGTFVGSSSPTVDSDLIIGIWDTANSKIIEPSNRLLESMVTGLVYDYKGEFQLPTNATTFKLFIHHANAGASTFEIVMDDFEVSANQYNLGTTITDWTSYVPVSGYSNAAITGYWRRVGDSIECNVRLVFTGAPVGIGTFNIPTGYFIDTAKIPSNNPHLGNAWTIIVAPNRRVTGTAVYSSTSGVVILGYDTAGGWSTTIPGTFAIGDEIYVEFSAPILGWASSSINSDGFDGRKIVASIGLTSAFIAAPNAVIIYSTKIEDDTSSYSTVTGLFTAPASRTYNISVNSLNNVTSNIYLRANGTGVINLFTSQAGIAGSGSTSLYLKAGDTLGVYGDVGSTYNATSGSLGYFNKLSIQAVMSPTTISSTELIAFSADTSTTAATTLLPFVYTNVLSNSFSAYSAVTGKFEAPTNGFYSFVATVYDGAAHFISLYKNGVRATQGALDGSTINPSQVNWNGPLVAGDIVDIRPNSAPITAAGQQHLNMFSGFKVK